MSKYRLPAGLKVGDTFHDDVLGNIRVLSLDENGNPKEMETDATNIIVTDKEVVICDKAKLAALLAAADKCVNATGAREIGLAQYDLQVALADFRAERSGL